MRFVVDQLPNKPSECPFHKNTRCGFAPNKYCDPFNCPYLVPILKSSPYTNDDIIPQIVEKRC